MGGTQIGPAAPPPQLGGGPQQPLGQMTPSLLDNLAQPPASNPIQDALQGVQQNFAPVQAPEEAQGLMGAEQGGEKPNPMAGLLGGFIEGIDKGFQSPATLLGVGLLNQQRSGLGTLGLGALGAYNAFKNRG